MYSAVITAAGSGTRAGLGYNKMLYKMDGVTLIEKSVAIFANNSLFNDIIVTVSKNDLDTYKQLLVNYNVKFIIGGQERMNSVANGVSQALNSTVFVHDGARIFLDDELINRLVQFPEEYDGLALATQAIDTTLLVKGNRIEKVLDRSSLFNMQTPQVVNKQVYDKCYEQAISEQLLFTDEVSMLTHYNYDCKIVVSESYNKKMTTPQDFEV
ncbi:IspD/TarI family cytidylyltransferase [Mollicutes bacterium LVI A0078]|nr:IspD/TarI family cytidylyltransferase [Mollicutes bacterium LVI A0075]WOO90827.1 IspD/TarI family cytidylyltransferase [Mollicutes bacterium LVI A0078]